MSFFSQPEICESEASSRLAQDVLRFDVSYIVILGVSLACKKGFSKPVNADEK